MHLLSNHVLVVKSIGPQLLNSDIFRMPALSHTYPALHSQIICGPVVKHSAHTVRHVFLQCLRSCPEPIVFIGGILAGASGNNLGARFKIRVAAAAQDVAFDPRAQTDGRGLAFEHNDELVVRVLDAKGRVPRLQ
jgi:hypothetical protein